MNIRARVQLFGHKHAQAIEQISFNTANDTLRIASGAVHPERKESDWRPRYNIISIEVDGAGDSRKLLVKLFPRVWNDDILEFQPDPLAGNNNFIDFSLPLEPWGDAPIGLPKGDGLVKGGSTASDKKVLTKVPSKNIELIGREKDLMAFEELINSEGLALLVNGLGGIGKTELCKRYFWKHYDSYEYVGWVNYYSGIKESLVSNFKKSLIDIADNDTLDIVFKKIIDYLQALPKNSLLIIDNVDNENDADLDIIRALPLKVAATSRDKLAGFKKYNLGFLSAGACKELFYEYYDIEKNDPVVDTIIGFAGFHTLTVELLAKTARNAALGIKELFDKLSDAGFNLNEVIKDKVDTFWHDEKAKKKFFEHMVKVFELSGVTEKEKYVLMNLSILPAVDIEMARVREWLGLEDNEEVNSLVNKGWLEREKRFVRMHPVVQEVVRFELESGLRGVGFWLVLLLVVRFCKGPGENLPRILSESDVTERRFQGTGSGLNLFKQTQQFL
ncbi:MAG: ATP-binding protein [bacterium]|nr:ATP-binding protein [bacterium]